MLRHLFGPVTPGFAAQNLSALQEAGRCAPFGEPGGGPVLPTGHGDDWDAVRSRLPAGWQPDFVALWLPYASIPDWVWSAPVPVVGLAADWNLLWHWYRLALPRCDLVLTDAPGCDILRRDGLAHARPANLFGLERAFLEPPASEAARDIDVLFVGNVHPAVQRERLPWLGRLAALAGRRNVVIKTNVFGEEYRALLRRARVVFNRSVRGECNKRAFEAPACGALLFQEEGNAEIGQYLEPGREYVAYTDADLEAKLERYLGDEPERARVAAAGRERVLGYGFADLWARALGSVEGEWPAVLARAGRRAESPRSPEDVLRVWERLGRGGHEPADRRLAEAVRAGASAETRAVHLGVLAVNPAEAAAHFREAVATEPAGRLARCLLAAALADAGQADEAVAEARRALSLLDRGGPLTAAEAGLPPCGPGFTLLRVEWERAAWANAGDPGAEAQAKRGLLRWRLHSLLARLTGELSHHYEAALEQPGLAPTRAALGTALARTGRLPEAILHLGEAVAANPFDRPPALALREALRSARDRTGLESLEAARRLLHRAAPEVVPAEPWFAGGPPDPGRLASVVVLCCNEVSFTRLCLESVFRHTRRPYELIVVDNGSSDDTPNYLGSLQGRPGPDRVEVIRNPENRGYAAGVNQGLRAARGEYLVLLNNDTLVTPGWLDGLVRWSLRNHPAVGLVGAVSNYTRPPQLVPAGYDRLEGLDDFARRRAVAFAGEGIEAERLTGFCLLTRRDVLEQVGLLDEGYGLGFFEDDDLCVRALAAGYRLVAAQDVYVHHFGSRTFAGLGVDTESQLRTNLERFRGKWGDAQAAGYRLAGLSAPAARAPAGPDAGPVPGLAEPVVVGPPSAGSPVRVSLCMIVRNEEANLPACLAGWRSLFDEAVVVDTGSTDRTREVAAGLGAKVIEFPWCDSFSAARNESLRHAAGAWVFWLDADDRIDEENRTRLKAVFDSLGDDNAGYVMKCLCVPAEPGGTATTVDHLRLFRNRPEHRWRYRVHEQILPALRASGAEVRWADVTVRHTGYTDPALRRRKLERDLRLLGLEQAEQPDDPFTLFNLGSVYHELGRFEDALAALRRSLERSHVKDSIVRKAYALVAQCHRQLGREAEALEACREARRHYPEDAELLFVEGLARRALGDGPGAEACFRRLLGSGEGPHFASVASGLRGYKARNNLAVLCLDGGRPREAEAQWRAALAEEPAFLPAHLGLGDLYLREGNWAALERVCDALSGLGPAGEADACALRGRALLRRGEVGAAKRLLEDAAARFPGHLPVLVPLSHALLRDGQDPVAAEQALLAIVEAQPDHAEARHNLAVLRAGSSPPVTLDSLYKEACKRPSDINEHLPALHELARGCRHVTEFGTRTGVSTTALLHAQPEVLVCYDLQRLPPVDRLERLAGATRFEFREENVLAADIAETDLLFIDTWHVYGQLKAELERHAAKARRWIVLHDTEAFRVQGESGGHRGLWPAVEEFLARGEFRLKQHYPNNNGLTVLERVTADEPVTAGLG